MLDSLYLVPLFPLFGVLINGLIGHRLPKRLSGGIACLAVLASFCVGVLLFLTLAGKQPADRLVVQNLWDWISAGDITIGAKLLLDPLSAVLVLVVTGIGFLIHLYSTGYMSHDEGYARYFVYLNLFTASMLLLVMGGNFLVTFVGWEGVGLCSYLLIGFWYHKDSAADAGKKAFIVNRIGDFGFMLGILLVLGTFGTIDYVTQDGKGVLQLAGKAIQEASGHFTIQNALGHIATVAPVVVTAMCLLLFLGCTGKSAQIPLYVWLPDAMEGPTPVSALIHAATMVTAGVYVVARCSALFALSPLALAVVACIGASTALSAATMGLVQHDIKRVLAYSTISQLGYMFLGCGVGCYVAGIFHLVTHAFFKALLFLGSGSVIHAMGGEQDMRKMGGLWGKLPITAKTMLVGTLAIAGIPPLAGFFSKDEILWKAFAGKAGLGSFVSWGGTLLWAIAAVTALLTAFYMGRLLFKTFWGQPRYNDQVAHHLHESPPAMTIPLIVLAGGSALVGFLGVPHILGGGVIHNLFERWLEPIWTPAPGVEAAESRPVSAEWLLMGISVVLGFVGLAVAYRLFVRHPGSGTKIAQANPFLYKLVYNKYFVDEVYGAVFVRGGNRFANVVWNWIDKGVIDGIVNGTAIFVAVGAELVRVIQTGYIRNYALMFLMGVAIVMAVVLSR